MWKQARCNFDLKTCLNSSYGLYWTEKKKLLPGNRANHSKHGDGFNCILINNFCFWSQPVISDIVCQVAGFEEGEVTWCGTLAQRKGELWVLWVGQDAATARCHHQPAGQSLHHPSHHQLPEDEGLRQPGWPTMEPAYRRTTTQHLSQRSEVTPCPKSVCFQTLLVLIMPLKDIFHDISR